MDTILDRYKDQKGDRELVFNSLCGLLSNRPEAVQWEKFGPEEWDLLGKIAIDEGVAEFAWYILKTEPVIYQLEDFDPPTYKAFSEREAVTAIRNALLFKQLERILQALSNHNISVVLLKGADFARSIYPAPGLRPMADLDLLVPQDQFENALKLVNALGYHEYLPEASPGLNRLLSHHAHLRKEGPTRTLLELHWTLVASPAFKHAAAMDWFWDNLDSSQTGGQTEVVVQLPGVFCLNSTANLLYLSAHQNLQHGEEHTSLRWLLDLHRLLLMRGHEIDWEKLTSKASELGWSGALAASLQAVRNCFATPIPPEFLSVIKAQTTPFDLLIHDKSKPAPTHTLQELKKLRSLNWPGRLRLLIALVFPSPAYMRWRYHPRPRWLWPLYYLYRLYDIILDGLKTLKSI